MRKNLIVICYNYALSRRIANILAEKFDMRMFDMYEMFKFHNMPHSLADVLHINGEAYVDKKMRGILKTELDFSGVVFVVDTKIIGSNQDLFDALKENNIVLFLKNDFKTEFAQRDMVQFVSTEEKNYFSIPIDKIVEYEQAIENNFADITINIDDLKYSDIKEKIIKKLRALLKNKD